MQAHPALSQPSKPMRPVNPSHQRSPQRLKQHPRHHHHYQQPHLEQRLSLRVDDASAPAHGRRSHLDNAVAPPAPNKGGQHSANHTKDGLLDENSFSIIFEESLSKTCFCGKRRCICSPRRHGIGGGVGGNGPTRHSRQQPIGPLHILSTRSSYAASVEHWRTSITPSLAVSLERMRHNSFCASLLIVMFSVLLLVPSGLIFAFLVLVWLEKTESSKLIKIVHPNVFYIATFIAVYTILVALFGLCGVYRKSKPILSLFVLCLLLATGTHLTVGYVSAKWLSDPHFDRDMTQRYMYEYSDVDRQTIQNSLNCCGFMSSFQAPFFDNTHCFNQSDAGSMAIPRSNPLQSTLASTSTIHSTETSANADDSVQTVDVTASPTMMPHLSTLIVSPSPSSSIEVALSSPQSSPSISELPPVASASTVPPPQVISETSPIVSPTSLVTTTTDASLSLTPSPPQPRSVPPQPTLNPTSIAPQPTLDPPSVPPLPTLDPAPSVPTSEPAPPIASPTSTETSTTIISGSLISPQSSETTDRVNGAQQHVPRHRRHQWRRHDIQNTAVSPTQHQHTISITKRGIDLPGCATSYTTFTQQTLQTVYQIAFTYAGVTILAFLVSLLSINRIVST